MPKKLESKNTLCLQNPAIAAVPNVPVPHTDQRMIHHPNNILAQQSYSCPFPLMDEVEVAKN